jgi:hypothetical protein
MRRGAWLAALLASAGVARGEAPHAERIPVAVLWLGDGATVGEGARVVEQVHAAMARSTARPLDSADDRRALVEGGPAARLTATLARAQAAFGKLKLTEAVLEYEAAERLLFSDVPVALAQGLLGPVERGLLACYDQLGRADDAARAAERLSWSAMTDPEMVPLIERHLRSRAWQPALAPVPVVSEPPGAQVYRNLQPAGATPASVAGGDPAIDVLDVEAPGYRREHLRLGAGEVNVTLVREDRLGVLVDEARRQALQLPAGIVATIGRRVGAARVLVVAPAGQGQLRARWLDVGTGAFAPEPRQVDAAAVDQLVAYIEPAPSPSASLPPAALTPTAAKPSAAPARTGEKSAWGRWYTWVAAAGVVALVAGLLIAEHVGDDKVTVTASH